MAKEEIYLNMLKTLANDVSHIQKSIYENKLIQKFKKKNVSVNENWLTAYAKLPRPKLTFSAFCSLAIKEKLEKEGVISKT